MDRCVTPVDDRWAPAEFEAGCRGLSVRAAQCGDRAAREQVLDDFLPLVERVARSYAGVTSLDREELVQEGVVGLFTAVERYDTALGVPFWAYASWWVRRMMQRLVAELTLPVVLSDRAMRQLASVKHARQDHEQAYHCEPSSEELVERTGYTHDQLDSLTCVELCPRSLEGQLQGEDGANGTLADSFADPRGEDGYDAVERELDADALRRMPNDLGDRERAVLRARYGFDGAPQTLQAVGSELHLTAERVRQIQWHALETLRAAGSTVLSQIVAEYADAEALDSEADRLGS
ncbi:MAG TPA: sigma-70 family RNA polymerase sigma factor [Gaiellales bacterium]|nr:sigma-70 family RNA polymerase sigma factor [Gaiellales bacterium]